MWGMLRLVLACRQGHGAPLRPKCGQSGRDSNPVPGNRARGELGLPMSAHMLFTGPIACRIARKASVSAVLPEKSPWGYCRWTWTVKKLPRRTFDSWLDQTALVVRPPYRSMRISESRGAWRLPLRDGNFPRRVFSEERRWAIDLQHLFVPLQIHTPLCGQSSFRGCA